MAKHIVFAGLIAVAGCAGIAAAATATQAPARAVDGVPNPEAAIAAALAAEDIAQLPKTPRLAALERSYNASRANSDAGENDLDFEYTTGAQEPAGVTGITTRTRRSGNTMTLTSTFRVFDDRTRSLTSRWLRGMDGLWQMDDVTDGKKSLADWYRMPVE